MTKPSDRADTGSGGTPPSKMTLRYKLTVAIVLFSICVTGILSLALFATTRSQMHADFRQHLLDIVGVSALSISADTLESLNNPEQEGQAGYLQVKTSLKKIKANAQDIHFAYTMRATTDDRIMFVVDESDNPDEIAHLGEIYEDASPFLKEHFHQLDKPVVEQDFYSDRWGTWLTGYAPIHNKDGQRVGVLGIDIQASQIIAYEKKLLIFFGSAFLLSIFLSTLLAAFLSRRLTAPILDLKEHAMRIGKGDFENFIPVKSGDELGILAGAFNAMTGKLKELVDSLQNEISSRQMAERKYRSIFDNALEGIFQSTFDGRLITVNRAFAKLLGYDSPEDVLQTIQDIPTQLYADSNQRKILLENLKTDGRVSRYRMRMRRKDGTEIWAELTAGTVEDDNAGTIIEGLLKDISAQLARETAEKEQQVAEAASLAKSEFLANMSHEIRTPMNAVMGLTHLAMKTDLTLRQADYLKKIMTAAQSLLRIIDDILDFSKIEAGRLSVESIDFNLEDVITVWRMFLG